MTVIDPNDDRQAENPYRSPVEVSKAPRKQAPRELLGLGVIGVWCVAAGFLVIATVMLVGGPGSASVLWQGKWLIIVGSTVATVSFLLAYLCRR